MPGDAIPVSQILQSPVQLMHMLLSPLQFFKTCIVLCNDNAFNRVIQENNNAKIPVACPKKSFLAQYLNEFSEALVACIASPKNSVEIHS